MFGDKVSFNPVEVLMRCRSSFVKGTPLLGLTLSILHYSVKIVEKNLSPVSLPTFPLTLNHMYVMQVKRVNMEKYFTLTLYVGPYCH